MCINDETNSNFRASDSFLTDFWRVNNFDVLYIASVAYLGFQKGGGQIFAGH